MPHSSSQDVWAPISTSIRRKFLLPKLMHIGLALSVGLVAAHPAQSQTLRQKVTFANADINAFWDKAFQQMGRQWQSPQSYTYSRSVKTACGVAGPLNALYCPRDHGIYFNIPFLVRANHRWGDFAAVTIMAHEYGHAVQRQLGLSRVNRFLFQEELQADCLAGVYAQHASKRGLLDADDAQEGFRQSYASGHKHFNPNTHGTREQRAQAFQLGFRQGFKRCLRYSKVKFRRP